MDDGNKTIEIMKAAMEKEKMMKKSANEQLENQIDDTEIDADTVTAQDILLEDEYTTDEIEESELSVDEDSEVMDDLKQKSNKSLFKNNKAKELLAKDAKIEELNDRLIRTMAEFDNFRKRTEKEKSQMYDIGAKNIIEKILPIVDNFERGLSAISDKEKESAFAQGIELIYKQLINSLEEVGVKPIEAVGNEFDPNFHNAVMHGEDENLGTNIISDEFQKGYMYQDTVIRYSMVKVVN